MKISLLKTLIDKNLVSSKVEIDADVMVQIFCSKDFKQENRHYAITKIIINDDFSDINFEARSTHDGSKAIINWTKITAFDGMTPERYAAVFNIDPSGKVIPEGSRRGPKKKSQDEF